MTESQGCVTGSRGFSRPGEEPMSRLLRAWRARVDRASIPELRGPGYRSRGRLSQADVARLTGVSEGWYRALETGSHRDFSDAFLLRVAAALRLNGTETLTLFLGVLGRRPPTDPPPAHTALDPALLALLRHQAPHPAYLADAAWNIVAANAPMAEWFPWVKGPRPNLMRWGLTSREAREQVLDWEESCARVYLATLRVASCQDQGNTQLQELLREVLAADAVCRRIWAEGYEVAEHHDGRRFRLRLPCHQGAEVLVTTQMFLPMQSPGLRFVVVTPLTP